jgi:hypothetical protein
MPYVTEYSVTARFKGATEYLLYMAANIVKDEERMMIMMMIIMMMFSNMKPVCGEISCAPFVLRLTILGHMSIISP